MKINRLFEIVYILLNKQKVTAKELSDRFEVSQRTIYRDIDTLAESGIPVYASKGRGGGISLADGYKMDKAMLTENEQKEILSALHGLKAVEDAENTNALNKLSSFFNAGNTNWIEVDFSPFSANTNWKNNFEDIKLSIINHNLISICYGNLKGETTVRKVEPIKLVFKGVSWYLYAYCRIKKDYRMFKLNRIITLNVLKEKFRPHMNLPVETTKQILSKSEKLVLWVDKSLAFRVLDDFKADDITKDDDGNYIINTTVYEREWIVSYILSLGDRAECIEPVNMRDEIKKILAETHKKYI